jgi:hypothetical protein
MSFRNIGRIVDKEENEKEAKKKHAQHTFALTQAYNLFLQGKTPVQVAIALNIREPEATQYYKEYWKLKQLYSLNKIYEEIKFSLEVRIILTCCLLVLQQLLHLNTKSLMAGSHSSIDVYTINISALFRVLLL